jgi:putative colanic acid biosynthesis acetyltransferase WcaF
MRRHLSGFTGRGYDKGRSRLWQGAWLLTQSLFFQPWWVPARFRVLALRAFGATIGDGVLIRHRVRVHWPWKLTIGNFSWIGEGVWILNLENVAIGQNVCISQEALLCTGSHDRHSPTFEFDNAPIHIGDGSWLGARAVVLRGVTIGCDVVVGATALVAKSVPDGVIITARANPDYH